MAGERLVPALAVPGVLVAIVENMLQECRERSGGKPLTRCVVSFDFPCNGHRVPLLVEIMPDYDRQRDLLLYVVYINGKRYAHIELRRPARFLLGDAVIERPLEEVTGC